MLNYYFTYIDAFVIEKNKLKPDIMIEGYCSDRTYTIKYERIL